MNQVYFILPLDLEMKLQRHGIAYTSHDLVKQKTDKTSLLST